jgi:hypothetical protein
MEPGAENPGGAEFTDAFVMPDDDGAPPPSPSVAPVEPQPPISIDAVDATDPKDQGAIRAATRRWPKRWAGIDAAKKAKWLAQLEKAGDAAEQRLYDIDDGLEAAKVVVSVVKTAAAIEGQNQADEHLQVKVENPQELNVNVSEVRRVVIDVAGLDADRQGVLAPLAGGPGGGGTKKLPPLPPIEGQAKET